MELGHVRRVVGGSGRSFSFSPSHRPTVRDGASLSTDARPSATRSKVNGVRSRLRPNFGVPQQTAELNLNSLMGVAGDLQVGDFYSLFSANVSTLGFRSERVIWGRAVSRTRRHRAVITW